jgi:hypothetical protein
MAGKADGRNTPGGPTVTDPNAHMDLAAAPAPGRPS